MISRPELPGGMAKLADFALQRRTLRRATVTGDAPVAIDAE